MSGSGQARGHTDTTLVVRLWREIQCDGNGEWRGTVAPVEADRRTAFRTLEGLGAAIRRLLESDGD